MRCLLDARSARDDDPEPGGGGGEDEIICEPLRSKEPADELRFPFIRPSHRSRCTDCMLARLLHLVPEAAGAAGLVNERDGVEEGLRAGLRIVFDFLHHRHGVLARAPCSYPAHGAPADILGVPLADLLSYEESADPGGR